jgi:serine phosphatase RsbU (regulator of sigma subunit)
MRSTHADRGRAPEAARGTWESVALALGTGLAAFAVGTLAESVIIRAVQGHRRDLEWISDVVISTGLAVISYLWLHLRAARVRVLSLTRQQAAIDEQLRLAAEIQRGLLPDVPTATPGYRWAARMVPAGQIGGDFYDFLPCGDGAVLVMVGDVSGKGVPAALILSSLKTLFRTIGRESCDPGAIAERISAEVYEEHGGLPYATAIVARIETSPARLTYVNAGHPTGYLLRDGAVAAALGSGGSPLGLLPGATYGTDSLELTAGDVGILVTDGITEALEGGPMALDQLLRESLDRMTLGRSPAELCDGLLRLAAAGPGPVGVPGWDDDRTVFVFRAEPCA